MANGPANAALWQMDPRMPRRFRRRRLTSGPPQQLLRHADPVGLFGAISGSGSSYCHDIEKTDKSGSVQLARSSRHAVWILPLYSSTVSARTRTVSGMLIPRGFRGLEIHGQIEPRRALDGKICRLGAAQNATNVTAATAKHVGEVWPIGDEAVIVGNSIRLASRSRIGRCS
jgi:hypothetical protein